MTILHQFLARVRRMNPQLKLFLAGIALLSITGGIGDSMFNNYLSDTFALDAGARGFLEFPRELPGLLTALFAGALFFLSETRIAAFSALCVGVGMLGIAIWGASWTIMLVFMFIWSTGLHMIMPVRSSVGMDLAHAEHKGRRLGQIQGSKSPFPRTASTLGILSFATSAALSTSSAPSPKCATMSTLPTNFRRAMTRPEMSWWESETTSMRIDDKYTPRDEKWRTRYDEEVRKRRHRGRSFRDHVPGRGPRG